MPSALEICGRIFASVSTSRDIARSRFSALMGQELENVARNRQLSYRSEFPDTFIAIERRSLYGGSEVATFALHSSPTPREPASTSPAPFTPSL